MLLSMGLGMIIMCLILTAELIFSPLDPSGIVKTRLTWPYGDLVPGGYLAKVSLPLFCVLMAIAVSRKSKAGMFSGFVGLLSIGVSALTGERTNFLIRACGGILASIFWKPKVKMILLLIFIEVLAVLALFLTRPDLSNRFTKSYTLATGNLDRGSAEKEGASGHLFLESTHDLDKPIKYFWLVF